MAYAYHIPLMLRPDDIWLAICQGVARHIDIHQKELRKKFVDFDGKKTLSIERPFFIKGSKENDWENCF